MKKYHEMTIEDFLEVFEEINNIKLSESEKKNVRKYATEFPKMYQDLPTSELLLMREVKKLQVEILDVMKCDYLKLLV